MDQIAGHMTAHTPDREDQIWPLPGKKNKPRQRGCPELTWNLGTRQIGETKERAGSHTADAVQPIDLASCRLDVRNPRTHVFVTGVAVPSDWQHNGRRKMDD